jgi:hypothetical protein
MFYTGYIEGYYGKLLSSSQRHRIIQTLAHNGLSAYIFAPKEDVSHRLEWEKLPNRTYTENLAALIADSNAQGVEFIPALAPGLTLKYSSKRHREKLAERISHFCSAGAQKIALLFDDIPLTLSKEETSHYSHPAQAQMEILASLRRTFPHLPFLFCPTVYTSQLLTTPAAHHYLEYIAKEFPENTTLMWTGGHTITPAIDKASLEKIHSLFGKNCVIWDNFYCNDYTPNKLFVGPYKDRNLQDISTYTQGALINGTGLVETDCFLLDLTGSFFESGKSDLKSWKKTAAKKGIPEKIQRLLPWFSSPYETPDPKHIRNLSEDPLELFTEYIVHWQGELKLEWYPFIHNLFTELKLETGLYMEGPAWFTPRFYPKTAQVLRKHYYPSRS